MQKNSNKWYETYFNAHYAISRSPIKLKTFQDKKKTVKNKIHDLFAEEQWMNWEKKECIGWMVKIYGNCERNQQLFYKYIVEKLCSYVSYMQCNACILKLVTVFFPLIQYWNINWCK